MNALGKHLLIELNDCDRKILNDIVAIREIMIEAANKSGATILGESFHQFKPQGVSGVLVIAESHLTIHTWPEHGYAGADIFTCGNTVKPEKAADVIIARLHPKTHSVIQLYRGTPEVKKKKAK
ncbi:MAG: S-adenosylmethionine decarboxylase proenzyme [Dehalococcoidales bacterium]|nr:S-adenosylmethionine decarboxylase proenzyme [Dehalococcoidales bacterium]